MVAGLLGNESSDSNRFTLVTPKSENDVRLQATLGNQNPTGLPVGVVSKYYNDDSKKVASTKLDEAEVGVSFNTISYHNGYAYINNIGLQGHKNPQNVIQIKGNSTEVKKLHLPGTTIDAVCADDHYYKVKIYLEETK